MLTDAGKESFRRNYSWLAQLLIESLKEQDGAEGLRERLRTLALRWLDSFAVSMRDWRADSRKSKSSPK
jgi:predicted ArsR family transcriptional regulator